MEIPYTVKPRKDTGLWNAKIGIWFLMVTFGASFGYTVMSRMSLMLGRLDFLFGNWLGMIQ